MFPYCRISVAFIKTNRPFSWTKVVHSTLRHRVMYFLRCSMERCMLMRSGESCYLAKPFVLKVYSFSNRGLTLSAVVSLWLGKLVCWTSRRLELPPDGVWRCVSRRGEIKTTSPRNAQKQPGHQNITSSLSDFTAKRGAGLNPGFLQDSL